LVKDVRKAVIMSADDVMNLLFLYNLQTGLCLIKNRRLLKTAMWKVADVRKMSPSPRQVGSQLPSFFISL
jgi:hypothetical protein